MFSSRCDAKVECIALGSNVPKLAEILHKHKETNVQDFRPVYLNLLFFYTPEIQVLFLYHINPCGSNPLPVFRVVWV